MSVAVGDLAIGVRADRPEWVERLRRVLAPSIVDDAGADPNLSAFFGRQEGAVRDLAALFRHGNTCFRTPRASRVVLGLIGYLDGYRPAPDGLMPVESWALLGPEGVVLISDFFRARIRVHDSAFRRIGYEVIDRAVQYIDPETHEIVIPEPRVAYDANALREVVGGDLGPNPFHVGRYPIRALMQLGGRADPLRVTSPARQLSSLAGFLDRPWHPVRAHELEIMGRVAEHVPVVRELAEEDDEIVRLVADLPPLAVSV